MENHEPKTLVNIIPQFFYRRMGVFLAIFLTLIVGLWQIYLYFQTKVFLEFHYSAVMLKLLELQESILLKSVLTSLVFFAFPCLLMAVFLIYYSHRIAGPMFRLKAYLREDQKDPGGKDLHFRESDVLHTLAESVNKVQHRYRADTQAITASLQQAEVLLERLTKEHEAGNPVDSQLAKLNVLCKDMRQSVVVIKT